ncbi:MAG: hypothetical protein M0C28_06645 [Candidatus Moduliflexus flocculans]|nr:hypothetical protein [Candidatus Moduliflexus flocculans]
MEIPGYTIVRLLGKGGMAYGLSRHPGIAWPPSSLEGDAIDPGQDENFTERFLKEGRIIAQFQHPQIITIYDFGSHGSYYYFSMEYFPEGTLAQQIERGLSLERGLDIIKLIAECACLCPQQRRYPPRHQAAEYSVPPGWHASAQRFRHR